MDEQLKAYFKNFDNYADRLHFYLYNNKPGSETNDPDQSLFSKSLNSLQTRSQLESLSTSRTHIVLVGYSLEPIIASILTLKISRIIFLYTHETQQNCNHLTQKLEDINKKRELLIDFTFVGEEYWGNRKEDSLYKIESSDPKDVYQRIRKVIQSEKEIAHTDEMIINITGGKKTMVGGAFTAGVLDATRIIYVDFEEYDSNSGLPIPGTEFIQELQNPINHFISSLHDVFQKIKNGKYAINRSRLEKNHQHFLDELKILGTPIEGTENKTSLHLELDD